MTWLKVENVTRALESWKKRAPATAEAMMRSQEKVPTKQLIHENKVLAESTNSKHFEP